MKIAVLANDEQWEELTTPGMHGCFSVGRGERLPGDIDGILLLEHTAELDFSITGKPVFVNSVSTTLAEIQAPNHVIRLNGWNSFIARDHWEVSGKLTGEAEAILSELGKHAFVVADQPGFVSARIISMIINEAYFALQEGVSTKAEIDIAMKLGTNYPYGPFQWASIIGLLPIHTLLTKLSRDDSRYIPSNLLTKETL
jgi:3-hydroxybutyryl-CoA dehydrogenase